MNFKSYHKDIYWVLNVGFSGVFSSLDLKKVLRRLNWRNKIDGYLPIVPLRTVEIRYRSKFEVIEGVNSISTKEITGQIDVFR